MSTTFKISQDKEWDEYQVQVFENGKLNQSRTYHTDDQQDAIDTWKTMVAEEKQKEVKKAIHFQSGYKITGQPAKWFDKGICNRKAKKENLTREPDAVTCKDCIAILKEGE